VPFGAGPRNEARVATAQADAIEAQAQLTLERDRIQADQRSAAARIDAARAQLDAAQRRARLARESRGFFDKSFQLGESDLPTRLRIEAEAVEAERQEARSRIGLAAAISAWRQSLGLLPQ
jgi:cobalt-zinc-cadmium efflux system outer membrane protein